MHEAGVTGVVREVVVNFLQYAGVELDDIGYTFYEILEFPIAENNGIFLSLIEAFV